LKDKDQGIRIHPDEQGEPGKLKKTDTKEMKVGQGNEAQKPEDQGYGVNEKKPGTIPIANAEKHDQTNNGDEEGQQPLVSERPSGHGMDGPF
jgi:hypothetical protein